MTLMDIDRIDLFHPVLLPWLLGLHIMELVNGRSLCCCARVCVCVCEASGQTALLCTKQHPTAGLCS